LLRRGLELGGWAPFWFALLDAAAAIIVIAFLAAAMMLGVQLFDLMAVSGGGKPALPLAPLFDGISDNPADPEFWWIYFLLVSTMFPSFANLAIGATSLVRGWPGVHARLLEQLKPGRHIAFPDRVLIALGLTAQWALGTILGPAAQLLLFGGIIFYALPMLRIEFLDLYRHLIFE
jgi:hypothetical protein